MKLHPASMSLITDTEFNILAQSMSELMLCKDKKESSRLLVPRQSVMCDFKVLMLSIVERLADGTFLSNRRDCVTYFGAPVIVIAKLWELIQENNEKESEEVRHCLENKECLLWAMHFMKNRPNITAMCKTMKKENKKCCTEKTMRKWMWTFLDELESLQDMVIVWENRHTNDSGADDLVTVDTTDCPFQQILVPNPNKKGKKMINKSLYSYKINGPALRYEIGLAKNSSDIVHVNGPFPPGDWNDLSIFRQNLIHKLDVGEKVEADDIYVGEAPAYVNCPASCTTKEKELDAMKRAEGRHEALSKHIKHWKCLSEFSCKGTPVEKMEKHNALFRACAVVKQASMELGVGDLCKL